MANNTVQIDVQVVGAPAGAAAMNSVGAAATQAAVGVNSAASANSAAARTASPAANNSRQLAAALAQVAGQGGPLGAVIMQVSKSLDTAAISGGGLKTVLSTMGTGLAFAGIIAAGSQLISIMGQLKQAVTDVGDAQKNVFGKSESWFSNLRNAFYEGYTGNMDPVEIGAPSAGEMANATAAQRDKQIKALLDAIKVKSVEDQVAAEWLASGQRLTGADAATKFRAEVDARKASADAPELAARKAEQEAKDVAAYNKNREQLEARLSSLQEDQANTNQQRTLDEAIQSAADNLDIAAINLKDAATGLAYWQGGKGGKASLDFGFGQPDGLAGQIGFDASGDGSVSDELQRANWTSSDRAKARKEQRARDKLQAKLDAQANNKFAPLTTKEKGLLGDAWWTEFDGQANQQRAQDAFNNAQNNLTDAQNAAADFKTALDDSQMAADIAAIKDNLKVVN